MSIITALPTPPTRSSTPDIFAAAADAFMAALPIFGSEVNTLADTVSTDKTATTASAVAASNSATTATTQAGIATDQAGTATTQAGVAAAQAGTATTQAGIALAAKNDFASKYLGAFSNAAIPNFSVVGSQYFNTTANSMMVSNGTAWVSAGATTNGTSKRQITTATASQTVFTVTGGYDAGMLDVYKNGLKLLIIAQYTETNSTTITLITGATAGDKVETVAFGSFVPNNMLGLVGGVLTGPITVPAGIAAAPSINFTGSTATGAYSSAADTFSIAVAGILKASFSSTGLTLVNALAITSGGTGATDAAGARTAINAQVAGSYESPLSFSNGINRSVNAVSLTYGTSANTVCQGNDSRVAGALQSTSISSWALAGTKPTYNYGEVGAAPSGTYVNTFNARSGTVTLTNADVTAALGFTPAGSGTYVNTFNTRSGTITLLSTDITTALAYTPVKTVSTRDNSSDLDTLSATGIYSLGSGNTHTPGQYGTMLSINNSDVNTQLYLNYNGGIYYRSAASSTLVGAAWRTIWDSANLTNNNQLSNGMGYLVAGSNIASATYATSAGSASTAGSANTAGTASLASALSIAYNNASNASYQMLWGSGNSVYGGSNILCNPSTGTIYATTVTTSSDERLKKDWEPLATNFVEILAELKSGTYTRIDTGIRQVGVPAQALQVIMPEAVLEREDGMLSVSYGNAALAACVELAKRIVYLEQELNKLKGS